MCIYTCTCIHTCILEVVYTPTCTCTCTCTMYYCVVPLEVEEGGEMSPSPTSTRLSLSFSSSPSIEPDSASCSRSSFSCCSWQRERYGCLIRALTIILLYCGLLYGRKFLHRLIFVNFLTYKTTSYWCACTLCI